MQKQSLLGRQILLHPQSPMRTQALLIQLRTAQLHTKKNEQPEEASPFAWDKTSTLIKKYLVYRAMGSNLFINYSLSGVNMAYRIFGKTLTNVVIERTSGSIFTGGVTLDSVKKLQALLRER